MPLIHIHTDNQFLQEMHNQKENLVVVDFMATWCGPCVRISPKVEELSRKYPKATFLKVDVDLCKSSAATHGVSAMPTFIFFRNKTKLDSIQGADAGALEEMIIKYYGTIVVDESETLVPGYMNLSAFIQKNQCEAMNDSDEHSLLNYLEDSNKYLESDCDPQLILSLGFNQAVKIHSIRIKAPEKSGPKTVKLFINQPTTLDFDSATNNICTQELEFTPKDLEGEPINLRFVKFQNVHNLQIFVKDNQSDAEITRIDVLSIYGLPVATTNMQDFKRVAGKKGEAH